MWVFHPVDDKLDIKERIYIKKERIYKKQKIF